VTLRLYRLLSNVLLLLGLIQLSLVIERVWAALEKRRKFDWDPTVAIYLNPDTALIFYLGSLVLVLCCFAVPWLAKRTTPQERHVSFPVAIYVVVSGLLIFTLLAISPFARFTS
jgi:uncharacterized membrane protein (DUF485 family)